MTMAKRLRLLAHCATKTQKNSEKLFQLPKLSAYNNKRHILTDEILKFPSGGSKLDLYQTE